MELSEDQLELSYFCHNLHEYAIRIDDPDETGLPEFYKYITRRCKYFVYGQERKSETGMLHQHWYVYTQNDKTAINAWFRRNGFTPQSRAIQVVKNRLKAIAYTIKNGDTVWSIGFPALMHDASEKYDISVKNDLQVRKNKRVIDDIRHIAEKLLKDQICGLPQVDEVIVIRFVEAVVDYYVKQGKSIRRFQILSYAQTFCCEYSSVFKFQFAQSIYLDLYKK